MFCHSVVFRGSGACVDKCSHRQRFRCCSRAMKVNIVCGLHSVSFPPPPRKAGGEAEANKAGKPSAKGPAQALGPGHVDQQTGDAAGERGGAVAGHDAGLDHIDGTARGACSAGWRQSGWRRVGSERSSNRLARSLVASWHAVPQRSGPHAAQQRGAPSSRTIQRQKT